MALCFCLVLHRQAGETRYPDIPRLMYYLVPFFSFILFVITEAFHIFYPDRTELKNRKQIQDQFSRPIKEDILILSQAVTSCELYLITITFLSVDSKVQKSLPTEALSLFTPMRHFTHGGRPPDIPEILYQSGRFNSRVCTLRAALEAEKPDHKNS